LLLFVFFENFLGFSIIHPIKPGNHDFLLIIPLNV